MICGRSWVFLGEGVDVGEESEEGDNGDKSGVVASPGGISDLSEVEETGEKEYGEEYFQTKTGIMDVIFEEWDGL